MEIQASMVPVKGARGVDNALRIILLKSRASNGKGNGHPTKTVAI